MQILEVGRGVYLVCLALSIILNCHLDQCLSGWNPLKTTTDENTYITSTSWGLKLIVIIYIWLFVGVILIVFKVFCCTRQSTSPITITYI